MSDVFVIANPQAGRGRGWEAVRRALPDAVIERTEGRGHAAELAAAARAAGRPLVVAAGGDGTVHEVVNGLLGPGDGPVPVLGVIALGSGCDYIRTFGIPGDVDGAAAVVTSDRDPVEVDAGEVLLGDGRRVVFANIAEAGLGAAVVDRATRLPRSLGPAMYLVSFLLTLPRFRPQHATVGGDAHSWTGRATNIVVATGRAFGGGMLVAPRADPSDGLFDVQVQHGGKSDYVRSIPKVYRGTHVPHPRVEEFRAADVSVTTDPPAVVEADGEVIGRTPATFRVLPRALRLKV